MPSTDLLFAVEGPIGVVTINRPEARNALLLPMYARIAEICRDARVGGPVKAIVIRGAGGKAFASGTDISEFRDFTTAGQGVAYEEKFAEHLDAIERCQVPTIAALAGACTGGGAAIAACCDIRLASADLRFGFPIARTLGNALGAGILARVAAQIGLSRAKDLLFQARLMGAEEALRIGFVTEVLPTADALEARAREVAATVASHAPVTLAACKEIMRRITEAGLVGVQDRDMVAWAYGSADFREGRDAFLAKRAPKWTGK